MRPRAYARALLVAALACFISGCGASSGQSGAISVPHVSRPDVTVANPSAATFQYALDGPSSCADGATLNQVSDAITVLKVSGKRPVRIDSVRLTTAGIATSDLRITYRVLAFRPEVDGEITGGSQLRALGHPLSDRAASGAILEPVTTAYRWYVVVARVHLRRPVTHPWTIYGPNINFGRPNAIFGIFYEQYVRLRATRNCMRTGSTTGD